MRTGIGVATIAFYGVLFLAGRSDLLATSFHVSLNRLMWTLRATVLLAPPIAGYLGWRICRDVAATQPPAPTISEA